MTPSASLEALIRKNGYSRVVLCADEVPKEWKSNILYLKKEHGGIVVYAGSSSGSAGKLSQKQAEQIEAKIKFPTDGSVAKLDPKLSEEIISICRYPRERSPQVQQELTEVYQRFGKENQ